MSTTDTAVANRSDTDQEEQASVSKYLVMRSHLDIVNRKPTFEPFDDLPRYWVDGHKGLTQFNNIFSLVIPEGEKFFIRSVMRVKKDIKDPQLLDDIISFSKQEAHHAKAHIEFNNVLRKHGYDVDGFTKFTKRYFYVVEKFLPAKIALALTVFMEHLTAVMAEGAHRFPELQEGLPKEARDFWDWHAVEEMEHKSVAFDVLTEIGGGYFTRTLTAGIFITLCIISMTFITPVLMILGMMTNRGKDKPAEKSVTLKELEAMRPGVMGEWNKFVWQSFKKYFHPGFHPWQNDDIEYITRWREKNTLRSNE